MCVPGWLLDSPRTTQVLMSCGSLVCVCVGRASVQRSDVERLRDDELTAFETKHTYFASYI